AAARQKATRDERSAYGAHARQENAELALCFLDLLRLLHGALPLAGRGRSKSEMPPQKHGLGPRLCCALRAAHSPYTNPRTSDGTREKARSARGLRAVGTWLCLGDTLGARKAHSALRPRG